ncbi:MAG: hypothetical protein IPJ04_07950 [Candidatus Eisenbacteria bacterium]|nr:hypothetical protein [Candidatus Eisenbacteria bacterium]
MNRDISWLLAPLVAIGVFAFVLWQTMGALSASGAWARGGKAPIAAPNDPFVLLDAVVAPTRRRRARARDPFQTGAAPAPAKAPAAKGPAVAPKPVAPARPLLTAIVFDADPRALLRWNGRDYSVRPGGLFDDFQVVSITRDQVVLSRNGENIVLQRKPQGE